jgi:hypothetical protein
MVRCGRAGVSLPARLLSDRFSTLTIWRGSLRAVELPLIAYAFQDHLYGSIAALLVKAHDRGEKGELRVER